MHTRMCTQMHTHAHSPRIALGFQARELSAPPTRAGRQSKSREPAQWVSRHVGVQEQRWGRGAPFPAHTGSPQARRQPGLQASRPSPRLSAASTATAPASRGTTAAAGRTAGGSVSGPYPSCPHPDAEASPVGAAGSWGPWQGIPRAGGRAGAVSWRKRPSGQGAGHPGRPRLRGAPAESLR